MSATPDTWSEEHRRACLARWALEYHGEAKIPAFLARWKRNHGTESFEALREELRREARARRARRRN